MKATHVKFIAYGHGRQLGGATIPVDVGLEEATIEMLQEKHPEATVITRQGEAIGGAHVGSSTMVWRKT